MSGGVSAGTIFAGIGAATAVAGTAYSIANASGGGNSNIQETAQGHQAAAMALDQYNTYISDFKPTEQAFISDVMKPTTVKENQQKGIVNADVAQGSAIPAGDPNRLLRKPGSFTAEANVDSAAQNNAVMAVRNKQLLGEQAITDVGLGKASNADLTMNNLANSAEQQAIAGKENQQAGQGAIANTIGSAGGAISALGKNWTTTTPDSAIVDNGQGWGTWSDGTPADVDNYIPPVTTEV